MSGQQFANEKYRNWVKAVLGFKHVREGLEPFCDDIVKQQHADIVNNVKQRHNLTTFSCGQCNLRTLQPDHVRTKYKQCPLGHRDCNCQYPGGKVACPNNVCGAIYDEIINLHASIPPSPYWKNTDVNLWCSQPWAIAKCFINASGYSKKSTPSEIDCSGLLHVLINNKGLQKHIHCSITGTDVFSKVRQHRNIAFHSENMEIEDADVITYIDDMIDVLQDSKELYSINESKSAVQKLLQLKQHDFIITASMEAEVKAARTLLIELKNKLGQTFKAEVEQIELNVQAKIKQKGLDSKTEVDKKGSVVKAEIAQKASDVKAEVDQKGSDVKAEIAQKASDAKADVDRKGSDVKAEVDQKGSDVKAEIAQKASDVKAEFDLKGWHIQANLEQKGKRLQEHMYSPPPSEQLRLVQTLDENNFINWKAGFREKLVGGYMKYAIKASALPLQPERYQREVCDVYVPQWMTVEIERNEESGNTREISISMHELFRNEENPSKNIFILGEAGSGKSTFCKILIYYWCLAHSGHVPKNGEANIIIKVLNKYDYLFYVALRHYPDCSSIEMMLKEIHHDPNLITLLQKESDKCLILLDGLDEWTPHSQCASQFQTSGLPIRDLFADYTTVTTSRDWKFDTLKISDSEVDKKVKLKGISGTAIIDLSKKTVETLIKFVKKKKVADDFKTDLEKSPVADVKHVPMILQQLVCLWFDGKLKGTSRCAVYSSMLDLYFDWKALKASVSQEDVLPPICRSDFRLPDFFKDYEACVENNYSIYHFSHLAFETLFDKQQESCLTFTKSTFQALNIPDNVIACGLKVGILTEDQSACLFASRRQPSSFSFVHKSMQEYLAAVYVAIQYETTSQPSCVEPKSDIGKHTEDLYQFVSKYFVSCTSVTDILNQSNVFIMLSGLKTRLLPYISEYIYNIATSDNQMIQERKLTQKYLSFRASTCRLQENIQACIGSCIKEVLSREIEFENSVYIADIVVFQIGIEKSLIERQLVRLNNVLSLNVTMCYNGEYIQQVFSVLNHLSKCDSLQSIKYDEGPDTRARTLKIEEKIIELIDKNSQTLTTVCLQCDSMRIVQSLIQNLSHLHHLTSLQITGQIIGSRLPHKYCKSLCTFLEQSTQLQQIVVYVDCYMTDKLLIDFTKLKQLQTLHVRSGSISVTRFSSDNIEICTLDANTIDTVKQVFGSVCNARNLKVLSLWGIYMFSVDSTVTNNLTRLLPSLISLNTLELNTYDITDNIITRPFDMKHLKLITLCSISMSLPTWRKFIDSLPVLPQAVRVTVYNLNIMDTSIMGKDDYMDSWSKPDKNGHIAARQYVREKTEFFQVTSENKYYCNFVTKKAQI